MKKITRAISFYISLIVISVFIQSCCSSEYEITGSGTLRAYDKEFVELDTISGVFHLENQPEVKVALLDNFSLISSTMATSCAEEYLNSIALEDVKITSNAEFTFDNTVIPAGQNFSNLKDLRIIADNYGGMVSVFFEADFINKAEFEKQDYTFQLEMKTSNDLKLKNEITLFMNL